MVGEIDAELLVAISNKIKKRKTTVAVAESVTSGLLQFLFSNMPDAALFFQGGITPYNLGQKAKHLDIEPLHAASVNCVSDRVALEMARGAMLFFNSDWAIAITGYATPLAESENKLFAYYVIIYRDEVVAKGKMVPAASDPTQVQYEYSNRVLRAFFEVC